MWLTTLHRDIERIYPAQNTHGMKEITSILKFAHEHQSSITPLGSQCSYLLRTCSILTRASRAIRSKGASTSASGMGNMRNNVTPTRGLKLLPRPIHPSSRAGAPAAVPQSPSTIDARWASAAREQGVLPRGISLGSECIRGHEPLAIMSPRRPRDPKHTNWHDFDALGEEVAS
eukprot:scaffold421096_cov43-Prasinocladus_malaysianus.AAC.1